jgi:hypothetical protein
MGFGSEDKIALGIFNIVGGNKQKVLKHIPTFG